MGEKFNRLAKEIKSEYVRKGFSTKRATYIGKATAGGIYRIQQAKKK